jgi:hypothetical protein
VDWIVKAAQDSDPRTRALFESRIQSAREQLCGPFDYK